jgi:2'-5' RNA ligase
MMVRCFAALPIPPAARGTLTDALEGFRERGLPVRWVRAEGVHITLKFFGETVRDRIEAIAEALDFAVEGVGPIGMTLSGFGAFPTPERPRVLWAGIDAPPALELLQDRIERHTEALGFPGEGEVFRPHVTVARVREGERIVRADAAQLFDTPLAAPFTGDRVVLYESTPGPGGSVFTPLHEAALRG